MPKQKSTLKIIKRLVAFAAIIGLAAAGFLLAPMPKGPEMLVRYKAIQSLDALTEELVAKKVVRHGTTFKLLATVLQAPKVIAKGTYRFVPGMSAPEVVQALRAPIRQMVRIPQGRWAARIGSLLEDKRVATAAEYQAEVKNPAKYKPLLQMPLPKGSLEGMLYPDTYDFPPLLGADEVVARQLLNFQEKVAPLLQGVKDWNRVLTIASMVELEESDYEDRRIIAGVIENRLKKRMRLQIDATVNYGLQKWRRLTYADYRNTKSPYNTYRINGLPPGPICSPTVDSVKATLNPVKHEYLFYVALPDGTTIYAKTYNEHLQNVAKRRALMKK